VNYVFRRRADALHSNTAVFVKVATDSPRTDPDPFETTELLTGLRWRALSRPRGAITLCEGRASEASESVGEVCGCDAVAVLCDTVPGVFTNEVSEGSGEFTLLADERAEGVQFSVIP